jgi:O-antigen/teichoic acid export membrane protein
LSAVKFKALKQIGGLGSASVINIVLTAGLSLFLAKILPIEQFGITRTVTAYMVFLSMLGHFTFHNALASFVARTKNKKEIADYYISTSFVVLTISVLVSFISICIIWFSGYWHGELRLALVLIIAVLPAVCLTITYNSSLEAVGAYRALAIVQFMSGIIPFVIVLIFSLLGGLNGWIFGRLVALLLLLVVSFVIVRSYLISGSLSRTRLGELWSFSKIQIFSGLLSLVLLSADMILLERISHNMVEVAQYGMALLFAKTALVLPVVVGRVFFIDIANDDTNTKKVHFLALVGLLGLLLGATIWWVGPWLIRVLYEGNYTMAAQVLKVFCVGFVFTFLWHGLSVVNIAEGKPKAALIISLTGSIVGLSMLIMLIPYYGAIGAAWSMNMANLAGVLVGLLLLYFNNRKCKSGLNSNVRA